MGVDLTALDRMTPKAVQHFWKARKLAARSQSKRGVADQGNRSGVTAGKNMDGFVAMVRQIAMDNGVDRRLHRSRRTDQFASFRGNAGRQNRQHGRGVVDWIGHPQ